MRKTIFETVVYIHIKNCKLLLVRPKGKSIFYMPGGKPEKGENHVQALIREIQEELSINLAVQSIKHFATYEAQAHGKPKGIMVRLIAFVSTHKTKPTASREIEKIGYFTHDQYHKMTETAEGVKAILKDLKSKKLIR